MNTFGFQRTKFLKASLVAMAAMLATFLVALVATTKPVEAAFPGQNGRLVFSSNMQVGEGVDNPEVDFELFTINPDGTNLTQLTHNATDDYDPAFSPDGKLIAYEGFDGNDYEIFIMNADGGTPTKVTDDSADDRDPAFSPDGSKIAYSALDGDDSDYGDDDDIYVISIAGGAATKVTNNNDPVYEPPYDYVEVDDRDPDFSPDGSKIAYLSVTRGYDWSFPRFAIRTIPAAGGAYTQLTDEFMTVEGRMLPAESMGPPDYSPDGSQIVFAASPYEDPYQIYTVPATGGAYTQLTDDAGHSPRSPTFSPDGSKIATTHAWAIVTIPPTGGTPNEVAYVGCCVESLDWGVAAGTTNTTPTITSLRPPPGSTTTDRTPIIAATVTDQQTNLAKSNITLLLDDVTIPRSAYSYNQSTDRMSYVPEKKLSFGKHALKVIARDGTGLSTTKRWSFEIVHP
jgi:Tol biopolymer transport system component